MSKIGRVAFVQPTGYRMARQNRASKTSTLVQQSIKEHRIKLIALDQSENVAF
jgi:hypothetical protein